MLTQILRMDKYRDIALVGAGGKTTLINTVVAGIRHSKKILVSSTTLFPEPDESSYDFIDYSFRDDYSLDSIQDKGVYILCKGRTTDRFLVGLDREEIEKVAGAFDNTIIECDYSMGRPLKGFRISESNIPVTTDLTIGVLDIQSLGMEIKNENIFHLDKFLDITGSKIHGLVTLENLRTIVDDPMGLFLKAYGKRVLFINKVEKELDYVFSQRLLEVIDLSRIDMVIAGSLLANRFSVLTGEV